MSLDRLLINLDEELVIDIVRERTNRVQKSVTNEKYWGRDLKLYQSIPSTLYGYQTDTVFLISNSVLR